MSISKFLLIVCYAIDTVRFLVLITFPIWSVCIYYIQNGVTYTGIIKNFVKTMLLLILQQQLIDNNIKFKIKSYNVDIHC